MCDEALGSKRTRKDEKEEEVQLTVPTSFLLIMRLIIWHRIFPGILIDIAYSFASPSYSSFSRPWWPPSHYLSFSVSPVLIFSSFGCSMIGMESP